MSRQFSIPTVLRMVPNALLQEFFERLGHRDFDPKWPELKEREIDPILDYLDELDRTSLDEIESSLRSVFDLACDSGFDAIVEAAPLCGEPDLGTLVPDDLSVYGKAMWVFLNRRRAFDRAQTIHHVEHMSWWRKRNDLPRLELDEDEGPYASPEKIESLEREISTLLKRQGRGKECTVETFTRGEIDYFFAYPDDFVENVVVHDGDGRLAPEAFRKTLLVVFAYNREEGSLELCAKLPKRLKEELEVIFAREILGWELDSYEPDAAYELNQLKDESFDLRTDPQDRIQASINKMRLSAKHSGRRVHVEVDTDDADDNMHKAIRECVNLDEFPLSEWNATQVTFCFEFLPLDGRKHGRQTFDVTYPRSCSLRGARPERVELIQKYMKRWGIDRVPTAQISSGEAGG